MNNIKMRTCGLISLCTGILSLLTAEASAEEMLVLVDMSGSMNTARDNADGFGATRVDAAVHLARNTVEAVASGRRYALWTFNGYDYTELVGFHPDGVTDNKAAVLAELDALGLGAGLTPVADSLCSAVDLLDDFFVPVLPGGPDNRPVIELFSDGFDTSSSGECAGDDAANPNNPQPGEWEYHVLWKARIGDPTPPPNTNVPEFAYIIMNANFLFERESTINTFSSFAVTTKSAQAGSVVPNIKGSSIDPRIIQVPQVPTPESPLVRSLQLEPAVVSPAIAIAPEIHLALGMQTYQVLAAQTGGSYAQFSDSENLPQLGDATGDACVNGDDYTAVINGWGASVPRKSALDLNGDGLVDVDDYMTVIQNWGEGC